MKSLGPWRSRRSKVRQSNASARLRPFSHQSPQICRAPHPIPIDQVLCLAYRCLVMNVIYVCTDRQLWSRSQSLFRLSGSSVINQHSTHHANRGSHHLLVTAPTNFSELAEPKVDLMHQVCGLESQSHRLVVQCARRVCA